VLAAGFCVGGCQPTHPDTDSSTTNPAIDLHLIAQGANHVFTYKADKAGRMYISNFDTGQLIYNGRIKKGEQFFFDPGENRATINKEPVDFFHPANPHDTYRIYFAGQ